MRAKISSGCIRVVRVLYIIYTRTATVVITYFIFFFDYLRGFKALRGDLNQYGGDTVAVYTLVY